MDQRYIVKMSVEEYLVNDEKLCPDFMNFRIVLNAHLFVSNYMYIMLCVGEQFACE